MVCHLKKNKILYNNNILTPLFWTVCPPYISNLYKFCKLSDFYKPFNLQATTYHSNKFARLFGQSWTCRSNFALRNLPYFAVMQKEWNVCISCNLLAVKCKSLSNLRSNSGISLEPPRGKMLATLGGRAFQAAASHLWNDLPLQLRTIESIKAFLLRQLFE